LLERNVSMTGRWSDYDEDDSVPAGTAGSLRGNAVSDAPAIQPVGSVDTHAHRELLLQRALRWAGVTVALGATVYLVVGSTNVARGRTVSASSICPHTREAPPGMDALSRLTDGTRVEGWVGPGHEWGQVAFAMCTELELHPWVTVDLGRERTIREVVVYGRSDCCWEETVPLDVQLSVDNQAFVTVATRTDPFTADFPWKVEVEGRRARYVRLYQMRDTPANIVLSEVEVYGR
jgi:hypothetical protein